jgi:uncharacterized membrane protein YkvA (DUF1232 family)
MLKHYLGAGFAALYLLNFTLGVFEIPDNLPVIGNLDELAASGLLFHSIQEIRKTRAAKRELRPEDAREDSSASE